MGDISKNFDRVEHECHCGCGFDTVDVELNYILQTFIRDYYKKAVTITGPNRCFAKNLSVGGSKNSYHIEGKAADIQVDGVSPLALYTYLDRAFPDKYGFGLYDTFVHLDVRPHRARWKNGVKN